MSSIKIQGLQIFPTSFSEWLLGYGGISADPKEHHFDMSAYGDGEYLFRIRTGNPRLRDSSPEHGDALIDNLVSFSIEFLKVYTSLPSNVSGSCFMEVRDMVVSKITPLVNTQSTNVGNVLETSIKLFAQNVDVITECAIAGGYKLQQNWTNMVVKKINKYAAIIDGSMNGLNATAFALAWRLSEARVDSCVFVSGNQVVACSGCGGSEYISDIDGNDYRIVTIGSKCWMADNLRSARFANGAAITQRSGHNQWNNSVSSPSWVFYENVASNDAVFGKLYNWAAVNDSRGLCPSGWRVASLDDYNTVIDLLGGGEIAGGKMKSAGTDIWLAPNTGATNESGFSGLPGGSRVRLNPGNSGFQAKGVAGIWWTSTTDPNNSGRAHFKSLSYDSQRVTGVSMEKVFGASVRCVKK